MVLPRRLRQFIVLVLILFGSLLLLAVLISLVYSKQIKQLLLNQLNRQLTTEIKVGDFGFTLIRHFPYASFEMNDVLVCEPGNKNRDTLLYSEKVSLLFNVTQLFSDNVTIRRILVEEGVTHIRIDQKGNPNYEIWKKDTTGSDATVNLSAVRIKGMAATYTDSANRQSYDLKIEDADLSGQFAADSFRLSLRGGFFVNRLRSGTTDYIRSKKIALTTTLMVNTLTQDYVLDESKLKIADLEFSVSGSFNTAAATRMAVKVSSAKAGIKEFVSLLPEQYVEYFKKYRSDGDLVFNATVRGTFSEKSKPEVAADFLLTDGRIQPQGESIALEGIHLKGTITTNNGPGSGTLDIRRFEARLGPGIIHGDLKITDFATPYLTAHATTALQLDDVKRFLSLDTLESMSGSASINVSFAGHTKDINEIKSDGMKAVQSSGSIELKDASFKLKQNPLQFTAISGVLQLKDDQVIVPKLTGRISSSDIQISGTLHDFFSFLLINDRFSSIEASLYSSHLNLDELLINSATTTRQDTAYKLKVNPRLLADLDVQVGQLQFRRFRADNLKGRIHLEDQVLSGRGLGFSAMSGEVKMDAVINVARRDSIMMSCDASVRRMDIHQLFYELENFDQDVLTDKNVNGLVSASVQFKSAWSKDLAINPASVKSTCDITIENGQLVDFAPIMSLSNYLKLKDLRDIRFSTLHNVISIANRQIILPQMEIKSSAINISGSGLHSFDNIIDYKVKLSLSDVLGKKVKNQSEFGEIEDDGLGHTQLFLTMKGPVDDPKISLDKKAVIEKIKSDISREKSNLKDIIRQEFGGTKKDTLHKQEPPRKKKEELEVEW